jgi:ribosomal protein S12 methylthiotransferase
VISDMPRKKTLSVISLGCFRNTYDSEVVVNRFTRKGYVFKPRWDNCDLLIVNTCGFIDKAKQESVEVIEQALDLKKKGRVQEVAVFGCLVQRYRCELEKAFPEVDQWWGVEEFKTTAMSRENLLPAYISFLKICEGCFNRCSYCAIPLIKGKLKSRKKRDILAEARLLASRGVRELNIIGQDITSWGKDLGESEGLTGLLKSILRATRNINWIRLIYTHPRHLSDSLIDLIAGEERVCKYIDLPIQHINDRILKLMHRGISRQKIEKLISKIRRRIPGCVLRTSVIVGFPTESEAEFKELMDFLKDTKFDRLGVFTYSREEGTAAYNLEPQVHHSTKMRRYRQLMQQQQDIAQQVNSRFLGKCLDVLIEERENNMSIGRSQYDAYEVDGAVFVRRKDLRPGEFYKAKIVDVYGYDLVGE